MGATPRCAAPLRSAPSSTSWNVILAVLPSSAIRWLGSERPGTWTTMRSSPWRSMEGSRVPSVDALAHDFDRLVDDILLGLAFVIVGHLQGEKTLAVVAEFIGLGPDREHAAAGRRIQGLNEGPCLRKTRGVFDLDRDRVAGGRREAIADGRMRLA